MHNRVSKQHFNDSVEKVQKKLTCWKSNNLMLPGRAILAQSVSSTISSYNMQTMHLPINICNQLDRLNRSFLWGDMPSKRKIHLVNWNQVWKKKDNGGLGLKKANVQNLALLSKLSWKMVNEKESMWRHTLREKYLKNHTAMSWPKNRPAFPHIYREVLLVPNPS